VAGPESASSLASHSPGAGSAPQQPPPKTRSRGPLIGVAIALLIVIVVGVLIAIFAGDTSAPW
jgi:hypothetical protein